MSPINPNFKPGVGHLVTDRFDFQKHVDGTDFRHVAGSIDLHPSITIGSTTLTNVQDCLAALAGTIIVPSVPDATTISKGVIQLSGDIAGSATNILVTQIRGTPIGTLTPSPNDVFFWNGANWTNGPIVPATTTTLGTIKLAGDLGGIGSSANAPRVGALQGFTLSSATPSTGQALVWNGSVWTPTGIPTSPSGTGFATLTSGTYDPTATANIRYASGKFQTDVNLQFKNVAITGDLSWAPTSTNKTLTLPDITDTVVTRTTTDTLTNKTINATNNTITDTSATLGDILAVVSGTKFTRLAKGSNGTFLGVSGGVLGYFSPTLGTPTGTGFATVTSGVFDSSATANIRYTGGKLQTDVSIQYKNGAVTGDLSWPVSGTNKTLGLPNATDTLVGQATIDTLTNKTINASNNTITDSSTVAGDLLKSNGTSFLRFAKGTALQVLRVNSGATDLEYASVSFPATPVSIDQSGAGQLNNVLSTNASNDVQVIRFTGDGAATPIIVSGVASGASVRRICLQSTSTSSLILSHEDTNSTNINRIHFWGSSSQQYVVGTDGYSIDIVYDATLARWRPVFNSRGV